MALCCRNNQPAANNLVSELRIKFEFLANQPNAGRERHELLLNLRSFPHKRYIIFYFPINDGIEIFRVLHGSRDITEKFEDLLPGDSIN